MGYIIDLGSKKRKHRTLIARSSHYHRTQTRVIHKRFVLGIKWRFARFQKRYARFQGRGGDRGAADNRTEIISPANEQYKGRRAAVPVARRRSRCASRVPKGPEGRSRGRGGREAERKGKGGGYQMRVKQHLRKRQR